VYVSQMLGTPLRPGTLRALYDDEAPGGEALDDEGGGA
jgi:hypothetical protein